MTTEGAARRRRLRAEVPADWRERATISIAEYAAIAEWGWTLPTPLRGGGRDVIRIGRHLRVPVPALLRRLEGHQ